MVRTFALPALLAGLAAAVPARAAAPFLNVAHRGASAQAPEHTFAAYDLALSMGADYLEQDLQLTSDGVLVVLHDGTLDRTARGAAADCTGPVDTKTLAQIKTCDVGSWFNDANPERARPEYAGLRIPTLEEVFQRYGRRVNYYIETKSPDSADRMEERLLALLDIHGLAKPAARRWQVLIQSFSPASLEKLHALAPALPLIQLVIVLPPDPDRAATLDGIAEYAAGIGPAAGFVDAGVIAAAHERCLAVHPWTVDDPATMASLVAAGADGLFTNAPDALETVLDRRATRAKRAAKRAARRHAACVRRNRE